jgi:tRNA G10  N-methylase Trm11
MPKFFFEAGSFQDLSYAELNAVFNAFGVNTDIIKRFSDKIFLIDSKDFTPEIGLKVFSRLGGFIRFGEIVDSETFLEEYYEKEGKVVFGISVLDVANEFDNKFVRNLSRNIKQGFKDRGISSRFIDIKDKKVTLNAAQVINNKVLEKGFELCLIDNESEKLFGKTYSIQDVDGFAKRDYGKPHTDTEMGTLPPKLARMLVNLTGRKDGIIWDPFCGSGTILLEAAVLGFDILGSDIDEKAIFYSDENIIWLEEEGMVGDIQYNVFPLDITDAEKRQVKDLKDTGISAVVCEPYMGPAQRKVISPNRADELLEEVKELYVSFFDVVERVLRRDGVVVMILPSYKTYDGWKTFSIYDLIGKRWNVLNQGLSAGKDLKWSRKNSIITRNIFVLQKR